MTLSQALIALCFEIMPDEKQLQQRYRELAKVHHPDTGGDAKKFNELHEAYRFIGRVLSDKHNDNKPKETQFTTSQGENIKTYTFTRRLNVDEFFDFMASILSEDELKAQECNEESFPPSNQEF